MKKTQGHEALLGLLGLQKVHKKQACLKAIILISCKIQAPISGILSVIMYFKNLLSFLMPVTQTKIQFQSNQLSWLIVIQKSSYACVYHITQSYHGDLGEIEMTCLQRNTSIGITFYLLLHIKVKPTVQFECTCKQCSLELEHFLFQYISKEEKPF